MAPTGKMGQGNDTDDLAQTALLDQPFCSLYLIEEEQTLERVDVPVSEGAEVTQSQ